jgi:hypothetical protein
MTQVGDYKEVGYGLFFFLLTKTKVEIMLENMRQEVSSETGLSVPKKNSQFRKGVPVA